MQEPSYLGLIVLESGSHGVRRLLIQVMTWVYKDSIILRYLPSIKYQYVTYYKIDYSLVGFLVQLLMFCTDTVDSHKLYTGSSILGRTWNMPVFHKGPHILHLKCPIQFWDLSMDTYVLTLLKIIISLLFILILLKEGIIAF